MVNGVGPDYTARAFIKDTSNVDEFVSKSATPLDTAVNAIFKFMKANNIDYVSIGGFVIDNSAFNMDPSESNKPKAEREQVSKALQALGLTDDELKALAQTLGKAKPADVGDAKAFDIGKAKGRGKTIALKDLVYTPPQEEQPASQPATESTAAPKPATGTPTPSSGAETVPVTPEPASEAAKKTEALRFRMLFKGKEAEFDTYFVDSKLDWNEAQKLGMSRQLFDVLSRKMAIAGTGDGFIDLDDIPEFMRTIGLYMQAFDNDDSAAYYVYNTSPAFTKMDVQAVIDARKDVAKTFGLVATADTAAEWEKVASMTFGQLCKKIDPKFHQALRIEFARLRGITPDKVIDTTYIYYAGDHKKFGEAEMKQAKVAAERLSMFICSWVLLAQMDAEVRSKTAGVGALPVFAGKLTGDSAANARLIVEYATKGAVAAQPEQPGQPGQPAAAAEPQKPAAEEKLTPEVARLRAEGAVKSLAEYCPQIKNQLADSKNQLVKVENIATSANPIVDRAILALRSFVESIGLLLKDQTPAVKDKFISEVVEKDVFGLIPADAAAITRVRTMIKDAIKAAASTTKPEPGVKTPPKPAKPVKPAPAPETVKTMAIENGQRFVGVLIRRAGTVGIDPAKDKEIQDNITHIVNMFKRNNKVTKQAFIDWINTKGSGLTEADTAKNKNIAYIRTRLLDQIKP